MSRAGDIIVGGVAGVPSLSGAKAMGDDIECIKGRNDQAVESLFKKNMKKKSLRRGVALQWKRKERDQREGQRLDLVFVQK